MKDFNYGENLRFIRLSKGISQEQVALSLNISQTKYSRIERQAIPPDRMLSARIANVLRVSSNELIPAGYEMETYDMRTIRGREAKNSIASIDYRVRIILILGGGAFLVDAVYQLAMGFCAGLQTSPTTTTIISWGAALSTIGIIYYFAKKQKKV